MKHQRGIVRRARTAVVVAAATLTVLSVSPAIMSSAELSNSAASLAEVVAETWAAGGRVCPLAPAESVELVGAVKDTDLPEDELLNRLRDVADGLALEAGFDDFAATWSTVASSAPSDTVLERERLLKLVSCFYAGELSPNAVSDVIDTLVATLGGSAEAADAAVSLLIDQRVVDAFAVLTTSDHVDSVPVASPLEDPETDAANAVAATLDDAVLSKDPTHCNTGGYDRGDKHGGGSQLVTTWNNLGRRNFSVYNEIGFTWNLARRCTKFGSASRSYEIHSCYQPIVCWEFDGYSYDQDGHYHFEGSFQGGWKSRMKANFSLVVLTWPLGPLKTQRRSIYNNLYGHFDGGISRFHGGYDPAYTSCEPAC